MLPTPTPGSWGCFFGIDKGCGVPGCELVFIGVLEVGWIEWGGFWGFFRVDEGPFWGCFLGCVTVDEGPLGSFVRMVFGVGRLFGVVYGGWGLFGVLCVRCILGWGAFWSTLWWMMSLFGVLCAGLHL